MEIEKLMAIMPKYEIRPSCGSDRIGGGCGGVIVEDNTFTRTCKCGFKITVDEDGNEI